MTAITFSLWQSLPNTLYQSKWELVKIRVDFAIKAMKRSDFIFKETLTAQFQNNPQGIPINKLRLWKHYDPQALKSLVDTGKIGVRHDGKVYKR